MNLFSKKIMMKFFGRAGIFIGSIAIAFLILLLIKKLDFIEKLTNELILLILIIFAMMLILSGYLKEFRFGSLTLILRDISEAEIGDLGDMQISYENAEQIKKQGLKHLYGHYQEFYKGNKKKHLILEEKEKEDISPSTIAEHLRLNIFDYVVFIDRNGKFDAYIDAKLFLPLCSHNIFKGRAEIQQKIKQWQLTDIPGIMKLSISNKANFSEALDKMRENNSEDLAVVDKTGKFLGIITSQQIYKQLVNHLIKKIAQL